MNSNLNEIISNPSNLIQTIFNQSNKDLNKLDELISTKFSSLFSSPSSLSLIPTLTSFTNIKTLPKLGSLIKFRGMIQDTNFGGGREVYKALNNQGQVLAYGIEEIEFSNGINSNAGAGGGIEDYKNLQERSSMYLISVPGENNWFKSNLDGNELESSISNLSMTESNTTATSEINKSAILEKYPFPSDENHFGCIAKFYGEAAESVKTCDVFEVIGILSESSIATPFDDLVASTSSSSEPATEIADKIIPSIHILFTLPISKPNFNVPITSSVEGLRSELIDYLAQGVEGDKEVAEWILLSLLGRIHTRHPSGIALGRLSLNLAYPNHFLTSSPPNSLSKILSSLLPTSTYLSLSIPKLNNLLTRIAPRNKDENLESGSLQVCENTVVVVDLRDVKEGVLGDSGVKNLRNLQNCLTTNKLSYEFPYSSFELDMDLGFILLSEGKAILTTDCLVYIKPSTISTVAEGSSSIQPNEKKLNEFRNFIYTMRNSNFIVPSEMSEVIQADFVSRRQKSMTESGGLEAMSQEDLLFRMTVARLMTLSYGETIMNELSWNRTALLDEKRRE